MKNSRSKNRPPQRAGRTPAAERERLVWAWHNGNQTQREFAQMNRIRYGTFRNWVSSLAAAARQVSTEPLIQFQEVHLSDRQMPEPIRSSIAWEAEVQWPSGLKLALAPGLPASRVRELMEAVRC